MTGATESVFDDPGSEFRLQAVVHPNRVNAELRTPLPTSAAASQAARRASAGIASAVICETEWISFRRSRIHGIGGFARRAIPAGTHVIEYVGAEITKAESLRRCEASNEYIFALDDEHDLDGNVLWNPARFINHSCAPNCAAELKDGRVWIAALREIPADEELTFDYGYDLEEYRAHPCRCGAPECVGYIVAEEFFDHVRRQRALTQA